MKSAGNRHSVETELRRVRDLAGRLEPRTVRLMEVCGTHTMSISRLGLRTVIPENVRLVSGPGCPVCVTGVGYVDAAVQLSQRPGVTVATFGDMLKVPGRRGSLAEARGRGGRVKVVYSPSAALDLARREPDREVVMLGVGFETTTPAVAACVHESRRSGLGNFSVLAAHKTIPPALRALVSDPEVRVDGFLCPGHVSVITGSDVYGFVAEEFRIPCVVAGFEAMNIVVAVRMLLEQITEGRAGVDVEYRSVVTGAGNRKAQEMLRATFDVSQAHWRGIGNIPGSGLVLKEEFAAWDAQKRLEVSVQEGPEDPRCRCGAVMRGVVESADCPLFAGACTPGHPVGPCMVSSEGVCAAHYRYDRTE